MVDTYQQITELLSSIPTLKKWNEIRHLFNQVASGKPIHWSLPILSCEAVGGAAEQAVHTALAIACSHISIILFDDMLDADSRGEYRRIGMPATANIACSFQSAALGAVFLSEVQDGTKISILNSVNDMILTTTLGQYLDVQSPADEEMYWTVVKTKSSPFFATALEIGALIGGSSDETAEKLKGLGRLYGEMVQIHDDLNDVMASPANPDWVEGRSPLPILFARLVDHPGRPRFLELCENIKSDGALEEAQNILISAGAVSYCIDQLLQRHQKAQDILEETSLARPEVLDDLIEKIIAPVQKFFKGSIYQCYE
jgi:geranylgeranyl pyrophosphate synthase